MVALEAAEPMASEAVVHAPVRRELPLDGALQEQVLHRDIRLERVSEADERQRAHGSKFSEGQLGTRRRLGPADSHAAKRR